MKAKVLLNDFLRLSIIYQDNHIIVVNKAAGLLTQGDSSHSPHLLNLVKEHIEQKTGKASAFVGMVHRLDKVTSGVVVFAKTSKGARRLSESFRNRTAEKMYCALVHGSVIERGSCHHYLTTDASERIQVFDTAQHDSTLQEGKLKYYPLAANGTESLLAIVLETGRKHQIRASLSHIGHPIIGDSKYGATVHKGFPSTAIALHSLCLSLPHPISNTAVGLNSFN